jgi:hypothetical protein
MSDALTRQDENGRRVVPANILVRSMIRPTRMLAGTGIFKGAQHLCRLHSQRYSKVF